MWLISLEGEHVFQGRSVLGYIKTISELDRVREYLNNTYEVEFATDKDVVQRYDTYYSYPIINSDKDITLVVELIREL